jgi:hypothetical protein
MQAAYLKLEEMSDLNAHTIALIPSIPHAGRKLDSCGPRIACARLEASKFQIHTRRQHALGQFGFATCYQLEQTQMRPETRSGNITCSGTIALQQRSWRKWIEARGQKHYSRNLHPATLDLQSPKRRERESAHWIYVCTQKVQSAQDVEAPFIYLYAQRWLQRTASYIDEIKFQLSSLTSDWHQVQRDDWAIYWASWLNSRKRMPPALRALRLLKSFFFHIKSRLAFINLT